MKTETILCIDCDTPMVKAFTNYIGITLEVRRCPKCNRNVFTQELANVAWDKIEKKKLEEKNSKNPIAVSH